MIAAGRHTISEVTRERDWGEKYPDNKSYYLKFQGDDLEYELGTTKTAAAPKPGETIDIASVEQNGTFPPKIKRPKKQGFGGGGGRSPEENARIMRQHSQEMALRYAAIKASVGELPKDFKPSDLFKLADHFDSDAKAAKP